MSGFCSPNLCRNDGLCHETFSGSTRYAHCNCQPGYAGTKCENRM